MASVVLGYVFPIETFDNIVAYIADAKDLAAIAASCRLLHDIAVPKLYRAIKFRDSAHIGQVLELVDTLSTSPKLAIHVKELVLDWHQRSTYEIEERPEHVFDFSETQEVLLPNVRELHILGATRSLIAHTNREAARERATKLAQRFARERANGESQPAPATLVGDPVKLPLDIVRLCDTEQLSRLSFVQCPAVDPPSVTPAFPRLSWLHICSSQTLDFLLRGGSLNSLHTLIYTAEGCTRDIDAADADLAAVMARARQLTGLRDLTFGATSFPIFHPPPAPLPQVTSLGLHTLCFIVRPVPENEVQESRRRFRRISSILALLFPAIEKLELHCGGPGAGVGIHDSAFHRNQTEEILRSAEQLDDDMWDPDLLQEPEMKEVLLVIKERVKKDAREARKKLEELQYEQRCLGCRGTDTDAGAAALITTFKESMGPYLPLSLRVFAVTGRILLSRSEADTPWNVPDLAPSD